MKITKTQLRQIIREELQKLNEALVDSREKYKGFSYMIYYLPPKGYYAQGAGKIKRQIAKTFFDTSSKAQEHAELEIDGYLDE